MHREIVELCQNCRQCSECGKNIKISKPFNSSKPLPKLAAPNEKLQTNFDGRLIDSTRKNFNILVAIDRYSKYPSALITKTTGGEKIIKFLRGYIQQHSIPKSIRTEQNSEFKNTIMSQFCRENGIKPKICPVGDHRGCGLVESCIQTIKRKLVTMQQNPNFTDIQSAVKLIIGDIRVVKHSLLKKSPFELHFGRKPNTCFSLLRDKLLDNLDCDNLEKNMLTPEQMRKTSDSRTRFKEVHKEETSRSVSPKFRPRSTEPEGLRTLESLAKAASDWRLLKKQLNHEKGAEILRNFSDRNPLLATTLPNYLNQGTLTVRVE